LLVYVQVRCVFYPSDSGHIPPVNVYYRCRTQSKSKSVVGTAATIPVTAGGSSERHTFL